MASERQRSAWGHSNARLGVRIGHVALEARGARSECLGAMSAEFIGREDELASIEAFLKRSEQAPSALVLLGEAGIGKTALWQMGLQRARERRARVLSVRAAEAEAALSFLGLSDLLAGVVDEVLPSLTAPRRRALQVALLLAEPGRDAPDPRAIGLAVLDSLRALAAAGGVVVAVDDLQWFDRSSAVVLQIALRRLRGEPVGFLATARPWPASDVLVEVDRWLPEGAVERLTVGPLSLGAIFKLLRGRLGLELSRPELTTSSRSSVDAGRRWSA